MNWSIYIPQIADYKPFYIQTDGDVRAKDTAAKYGLVAKGNPLPLLPNPKEPYKNDWADEHGDEEYTRQIFYQAFTYDVQFYIKTKDLTKGKAGELLREQVRAFFSHIKRGEFKVYDAYTKIGFRGVRYAGYKEDSFKSRDDWARAIFTITFKVNDPMSKMVLNTNDDGTVTIDVAE